jgi:small-conductance mechanosensitive channel
VVLPAAPALAQTASGAETQSPNLAGKIPQIAGAIWRSQLFTISDQPITVGMLFLAVAGVVVGFWVSRRISRWLADLLVKRLKLESGASSAIRTLGFYIFFLIIVFSALDFIKFPLTAFTIAGGALAIGVGFGSQNVMNNFISGLILHIERPIRVNDIVEVQNTYGTVEEIGARSTRIRALNATEIIVPNSFFLENSVVNFTLSDNIFRAHIVVGVVYGSPTREVAKLIRQAVEEHPKTMQEMKVHLLFADFGDNALVFEVYFSVRATSIIERRHVESEVRFRIDDLFREAGLVIAFPQRDVHLDTVKPLEVRMVGGDSSGVSQA